MHARRFEFKQHQSALFSRFIMNTSERERWFQMRPSPAARQVFEHRIAGDFSVVERSKW
jgi:hypothetical protein